MAFSTGITPATLPESPSSTTPSIEEKKTDIENAIVPLDAEEAQEYSDYLALKEKYDNDPKAFKKLLRKLDIRVVIYLWLLYLMNALDRSNAGNVKIYTLLTDTNMTSAQFNTGLTIYSCFYGGLEVPAQFVLQKIGPNRFLPFIVTCWGIVTTCHSLMKSPQHFWTLRALLGIFEAGLFQGCFYTMSRWFLPSELQKRNGVWYTGTMVAGAFGGLLAYAVGGLQNRLGYKQWQWLFIIEGVITIAIGLLGFLLCPGLPGRWRSKFFSADEMKYITLRVKYKDGPIAPAATVLDKKNTLAAFKDWKTYVHASLLAFGGSIPTYSVNYTLATMVKAMGYTAVRAQALTAPPYVFAVFCVLAAAWYSDKYGRCKSLLYSYTFGMIGIVMIWPALHATKGKVAVSYLALFLIVGGFNAQAPAVGALATNFRNPAKRAVAMGIIGTLGQIIGGVGGANIFIASEAPTYPTGFSIITAAVICGGVIPISTYWYLLNKENKKREAMNVEEIRAKYTDEDLVQMGEHSPLFRYNT